MIPTAPDDVVHFHEIQRPRWTIAVGLLGGFWALGLLLPPLLAGRSPNAWQWVQSAVLLLAFLAAMSRLRTVVQGHTLELERLRAVREAPYYPQIDGGWGVRNGRGVILTFEDGDVLYVGSARSEELCEVLRRLLSLKSAA